MQAQVFDWRWNDENSARIEAIHPQNGFGNKKMAIGDVFSAKIVKKCACAGFKNEYGWTACLSAMPETKPKCNLCRSKEGSFVYTVFDGFNMGELTADDLQKIQGEHVVYLALFDENLVKIGVSKAERKALRQIEQGSHATFYIAVCPDGIFARQIETLVRKSGFADKIQAGQKKSTFRPSVKDEHVRHIFMRHFETAKNVLQDSPELVKYLLKEPELQFWSNMHRLPTGPLPFVSLGTGESACGKIVGMKGGFLVLETPEERFVLNMKKFRGFTVDFAPSRPHLNVKKALQGALF